jgi:hypothetical protein
LQAARAELGHTPAAADDVLAALLDPGQQPTRRARVGHDVVAPGVVVVGVGQEFLVGGVSVNRTSRSSGARSTSTCGVPATGWPVSWSTAGVTTSTGVSSAVRTGSAINAARIAASNPAAVNCSARRAFARSTNPADTACPVNIPARVAARSVGTFPNAVNAIAAVFSTGP